MGVFGGEHLGFSYGGVRSEDLGIVRTIDNRYSYDITPPIKDITTEVPNYNGVYFWGSNYDRRNITIPFAFGEINETQLSKIKKILNDKKIHNLIFDEDPNIIYPAMVSNTSTLSHVCFDIMGQRVYRGEGSLNFICHTPYKRSKYKTAEELEQFKAAAILVNQDSSQIPSGQLFVNTVDFSDLQKLYSAGEGEDLDDAFGGVQPGKLYRLGYSILPSDKQFGEFSGNGYILYNASTMEIPFQLYFLVDNIERTYFIKRSGSQKHIMIKTNAKSDSDVYIKVDTKNYTITGCDANYNQTGSMYNDKITSGMFFNLVPGRNDLTVMVNGNATPANKIDYSYKYI